MPQAEVSHGSIRRTPNASGNSPTLSLLLAFWFVSPIYLLALGTNAETAGLSAQLHLIALNCTSLRWGYRREGVSLAAPRGRPARRNGGGGQTSTKTFPKAKKKSCD